VSLGPISEDLDAPATATATALLLYSLFVAAFVMLGAKVGKLAGERRVFQAGVVAHGVAMALMATSTDAGTMNAAQAIAGVAAAALVPTLVVLIAANYRRTATGNGAGRAGRHPRGRQRVHLRRRRLPRHGLELALLVWADRLPDARRPHPELSPATTS
jgi:MFS family permease